MLNTIAKENKERWKKSKYNMIKLKLIKPTREILLLRLLKPLVLLTKTNTIKSQQRRKRTRVKHTSLWLWSTLVAPETKLLEH